MNQAIYKDRSQQDDGGIAVFRTLVLGKRMGVVVYYRWLGKAEGSIGIIRWRGWLATKRGNAS